MSELSKKLMTEGHKGVHEQFDCVYAATLAYKSLKYDGDPLSTALRTHHKKIIKNEIKQSTRKIGFKPGFLTSGLGFYAYGFWEVIVNDRLGSNITPERLTEFTDDMLVHMADHLEEQFHNEGRADSIGFLKTLF
ncbi:MAG: hypothetical protein BMS9Abin26_0110 [Gammaproteobacteria bacterium]|nr:MAG: hypothetical protein BMS9Abin26_0110 [Gammaproteobacteria bacterium]